MLRFYAHQFYWISSLLGSLETAGLDSGTITEKHIEFAKDKLNEIITLCRKTGALNLSIMYALQMMEWVSLDGAKSYKELGHRSGILRARIQDELSQFCLLSITSEKAAYYNNLVPFGNQVSDFFTLAIKDIEEASKCLALDRGTAAVFHLMRVMEEGLKALARLLGISYAPSWESYIRQIADRISQKHRRKGVRWKRDEAFFKEILGNLESIKMAWRNPTMHIVRQYDIEEAEQIFAAVRLFMGRLAGRLSKPT